MKQKLKSKIISQAKKYHIIMVLLRKVRYCFNKIKYLKEYFMNRVDEKYIIFESFMGRKYSDSPKALYQEIIQNKDCDSFKCVWAFKTPEEYQFLKKNNNTIIVKYGSQQYKKYYAKSKYWITNSRIPEYINKKRNQVYIQCWHGTPLKRLGFDIKVNGGNAMNSIKDIQKKYLSDAKKYDYMVSPSKFCTEKFISAFNLKKLNKENIVCEVGYPRNDFLINYTKEEANKIKKDLNLPLNKKVILYAPTWRDNQHDSSIGYTYKTEVDFDYLRKKLSDEYVLLFRAHYFVANQFDFSKYDGFIYNVSDYDDVNDLYIISDMLVTDYSSVFFDYAILKRPIVFYMYDLDEYQHELRDFYIELDELPGNIVKKETELVKEINKNKNFKINKKYEEFNNKFNYLDDGNSSKRMINILKIKN